MPNKLIIFIFTCLCGLFGQYEPSWVSCLQTEADGSITINWTPAYDPQGDFLQNIIFDANEDTIIYLSNFNTLTQYNYSVAGVDANNSVMYFIFENHETTGRTHDTVSNILMNFVNNGGSFTLNWNRAPQIESTNYSPFYYIEMEQNGVWSTLDSVAKDSATTYSNVIIDACNERLNFRICLRSTSCPTYSNEDGGLMSDLEAPETPILFYVSVDTLTGYTVLEWDVNPSLDTYGYLIRKRDLFGNLQNLDNVIGRTNTIYIDYASNNDLASEEYEIAAYDNYCLNPVTNQTNNVSPPSLTHKTIFLEYTHNTCAREVTLTWNKYISWPDGVGQYDVIVSEDGGASYNIIASLDTSTLTYVISDIDPYKNYNFIIKAVDTQNQRQSFSNKITPALTYPYLSKYIYLSSADVISESEIQIRAHIEAQMNYQSVALYAGTDPGNLSLHENFNDIADLYYTVDGIIDQSYYFQIQLIDSCGFPTFMSNIARSVYLETETKEFEYLHTLNWTPYEDWAKGAERIVIERKIGDENWSVLTASAPNTILFEDNIDNLVQSGIAGRFCYRIKYYEYDSPINVNDFATSNISCIDYEPLFFMANAFKFNGETPFFKPHLTFDNPNNYLFEIYNRHGVLIFSTTDIDEGWDGRSEGEDPESNDVYVFHLKFSTSRGTILEEKGSVVLVK